MADAPQFALQRHLLSLRANIRSKAVSDTDIIQAAAHIVMLDGSQLPSSAMRPAVAQAATPITAPAMPTTSWQVHFVLCVMLFPPYTRLVTSLMIAR